MQESMPFREQHILILLRHEIKPLWSTKTNHVTCYIQLQCFLPQYGDYSTLKFEFQEGQVGIAALEDEFALDKNMHISSCRQISTVRPIDRYYFPKSCSHDISSFASLETEDLVSGHSISSVDWSSVTRFGQVWTLLTKILRSLSILAGLFIVWQKCVPTLAKHCLFGQFKAL